MKQVPLGVRPDLESLAPYVSPQMPARYRMNTNETPYAPPVALVDEVSEQIKTIALNRYPDRDAVDLFEAVSKHVAWPREGLWIANGSNEVFMHLFLGFGGPSRSTLLFEPTYSVHSLIPRIAQTRVIQQDRASDFTIDVDAALAALDRERPEIVIVCSPNNPTGMCEPLEATRAILERAPGLVVVDEAYIEFTDGSKSVRPLLDEYENLVVVKTFSKAWRLAGVRIGYMLAAPALIEALARVRLPYHLSAITQAVASAAIAHADELLAQVDTLRAERDATVGWLREQGFAVADSDANFVLFGRFGDRHAVWQQLLERGVLIRETGPEGWLRVSIGTAEEMAAFRNALVEVAERSDTERLDRS